MKAGQQHAAMSCCSNGNFSFATYKHLVYWWFQLQKTGPGYASPLDAMQNGPREKILYVCCVQPDQTEGKSDLLATVDVDPESPTYCQVSAIK